MQASRLWPLIAAILTTIICANAQAKLPLGMNTNEVTHQDASVPFVDLFRMSLPFEESRKLTQGYIEYDEHGWPSNLKGGKAGSNVVHWIPAGSIPEGNYVVLYEGEGQITYGGDARLIKTTRPGRDVVQVRSGADRWLAFHLNIVRTTPGNHIRNIRFLLPGGICANNPFKRVNSQRECRGNYLSFEQHHASILFNPDYLNFMRHFKTIRMMNISGITRNPMGEWSQMPTMEQASWGGMEGRRGVPLEVMVRLANRLNATPWFNIPEQADNDFIRRYAQYVKENLRPHLKPYVEYTNEAWNPVFTSSRHTKDMGMRQRLDRDPAQAGHKYYVKRSIEIHRIWSQIYGSPQRLTRVLGGWSANPRLTKILLEYNGAHRHIDALAIAPYFYIHQRQLGQVKSVRDVFRLLKDDKNYYSLNNVNNMLQKQMNEIKPYRNVRLIAYEGGQHLIQPGAKSTRDVPNRFLIEANRHPPMEHMYVEFLKGWQRITGNQLFVAFSAPRPPQFFGAWGIKEHINQPAAQAPKYRGLMRFF